MKISIGIMLSKNGKILIVIGKMFFLGFGQLLAGQLLAKAAASECGC